MTQLPVQPPALPGPVAAVPIQEGRDFSDIAAALESVGDAVIAGGRTATALAVGEGRLAEARFKANASELRNKQGELQRGRAQQKLEINEALNEEQVKAAAERLQTQELEGQLIKERIVTVEARDEHDEMVDREKTEIAGWMQYATPQEQVAAYASWRFLDPANQQWISTNLANKIAQTHLGLIEKKFREQGLSQKFDFQGEFDKLITGEMSNVPGEIAGPWQSIMLRAINDRLRDQGSRQGRNRQREESNSARDWMGVAAMTAVIDDGQDPTVTTAMVDGVKGYGAIVMGITNPDKLDEFVEEKMPEVLYTAFLKGIAGGRDPRAILDNLNNPDIPGIEAFHDTYDESIAQVAKTETVKWAAKADADALQQLRFAITSKDWAAATDLANGFVDPIRGNAAKAELAGAFGDDQAYEPVAGRMLAVLAGDPEAGADLQVSQDYVDRFYDDYVSNNHLRQQNPHGEFIKASLTNNWPIATKALAFYKGLLIRGNYAEAGRSLIPAMNGSPEKTRNLLQRMGPEGGHLYSAFIANSNLPQGSFIWGDALNIVNDLNISKWRSEAGKSLGMLDEDKQMPPPVGTDQSGVFVGLGKDHWNEHFKYWYAVTADSLKFDKPEEIAEFAAQKASDAMGEKFQSVTTPDGGTVFVPKQVYGILDTTFNQLQLQIAAATDIDDRGFLGFGSANDVEYQMDRGVRMFSGTVFVPGFVGDEDEPSIWYEFTSLGQGGMRAVEILTFRGGGLGPLRTAPSGKINKESKEAVGKRIHRRGQREKGEAILDAIEAGTINVSERPSERTRAENLIGRANTIAQVERMWFSQNQRRDHGRGYVWFFNEFVGGADVEPKDYDDAMSRPGRVFNSHMQGIDWLTKNRTGGVWSGQSPQWQADQLNAALQHLQYGEKFMIKPEEMEKINAFVESLRLP